MIDSIHKLQKYILKGADDFDNIHFKRIFLMTSPGCSNEEVRKLRKTLPGIPESYTKVVKAVNLNGISVGWFGISPCSFNSEGMVANLIKGNEENILFSEYARFYHLYSIATTDAYGIFVATASSPFKEGEIILIDESIYADNDNPEKWIYKLAKNFEQFLIVAGNINQIYRKTKDETKRKQEFFKCLKLLGVDEEYRQTWLSLF